MLKKFTPLLLLISLNTYAAPLHYSLEMEKSLYELKSGNKISDFCKTVNNNIPALDTIGKSLTASTCQSDYVILNMIKQWGDEIIQLSMSNDKKPTLYNYALPFGISDNDKFLALVTLKDSMFYTSIDLNNLDTVGKPKQQTVTNEQYLFFKDLLNKITDKKNQSFKPPISSQIKLSTTDSKELIKSKTYLNYANNLVNSKNNLVSLNNSLTNVFSSYSNYKEYLTYIYNGQPDDLIKTPSSFKNHSFSKIQCDSINVAFFGTLFNFKSLQKELNFSCK